MELATVLEQTIYFSLLRGANVVISLEVDVYTSNNVML